MGGSKELYKPYCMANSAVCVYTALINSAVCSYNTVEIVNMRKSFDPPTHTINQSLHGSYVLQIQH